VDTDTEKDADPDTDPDIFERKGFDIGYRTAMILSSSDIGIDLNIGILTSSTDIGIRDLQSTSYFCPCFFLS
jgi:hypothetical protein